jgi:hypothetical protein
MISPEYDSGSKDKPFYYLAGQNVICKVVCKFERTPAGYFVTTVKTGEHGFLQTTAELCVDQEVLGQLVCWAGGKSYMLITHVAAKTQ